MTSGRIRAAARTSAGLIGALLAAPALLPAQASRIPVATVQRVMSAEFAFCARAETAAAADLDALDAEIGRAMEQAQQRVNRLVADSVAVAKRRADAGTNHSQADDRLGKIQAERNDVLGKLKLLDANIARVEQGTAVAGQPGEHAQLMARETELRSRIATLTGELEKLRNLRRTGPVNPIPTRGDDIQRFFQGMSNADGPVAELRQAHSDLASVMGRLRDIRRETIPIRFGTEYRQIQQQLQDVNTRVGQAERELDAAKRELDAAKTAVENYDYADLNTAHDENLYAYEHFTRARHCVQKRRQQLAQAAPPVSPSMAGTGSGQWGVFCRFTDPDYGSLTDGGSFSVSFNGQGGVSGTYQSSSSSYGVGGNVAADGTASGNGSGAGWSVAWGGRFGRQGGAIVGGGNVTVTITDFGGGTCNGTWSLP